MKKALAILCILATTASADDPAIYGVDITREAGGTWRFAVTIKHGDTGWDNYADGWRIVTTDGEILGMRVLHHPHVNEQPFTRSLTGVQIPEGTTAVAVQAREHPGGWAHDSVMIPIPD